MIASSSTYSAASVSKSRVSFGGEDTVTLPGVVVPPRQTALGDLGAAAGRGEERRDPGAARAHPLGQRALRGQLDLELAGEVLPGELLVLPDVRRHHPPQPLLAPAADPDPSRRRRSCSRPPRGRSSRPRAAPRSAPTGSRTARTRPPTASRRRGCPRPPRPHLPQPCPRRHLRPAILPRRAVCPSVTPGLRPVRAATPSLGMPAPRAESSRRSPTSPACSCTSSPARAAPGKTTVAAALALALASRGKTVLLCEVEGRQGIAQLFDVPPLPYEERRVARGDRPAAATSTRWRSTPRRRCWSTSTCSTGSAAPGRRSTGSASIDFATTIAPGVRDVLLTGKVYEAAKRNRRNKGARDVRRGRARRAADRPDRAVPQRQRRAGRAGQGRADQVAGRRRDDAAPLAAVPRSTWSPCSRRCRSRRPATGSPSCARPACRSAASSSTWSARRTSTPTERQQLIDGTVDRGELVASLEKAGIAADDDAGRRPARGGPRPRRAPRASRTASARWSRSSDVPTYELPLLPGGVDLGGLYELAEALREQGLAMNAHATPPEHAGPAPGSGRWSPPTSPSRSSTSTRCSTTAAAASSSAAAPAASARPRRRRRWRCGRPSAAARSSCSTIDPARRLAQSMGIEALDNTPRPVPGRRTARRGGGSLDAMMLDMKRTFDEVVQSQASPEKAEQILANPFYIAVSSSFAGTQEYMAMEKLGQLDKDARSTGRWDLIVVDTPPSRSALDFLDAPERLSSFLDGRFMKLLLAPARGPARLMTAGLRDGHQRDHQDHRRPGAPGHAGVRGRVRHALRRLPPARAAHLRAAAGPAYGVPGGRRAGAGRAARGGVLRRAAARRSGCRWPGWSSTGRAASPTATCPRTRR